MDHAGACPGVSVTAAALVATKPSAEDRIRAALWFVERDFEVFSCWSTRADGTCRCPSGRTCTSAGKHPITAHGFEDATRDPGRIRRMLSAGSEPNYGLVPPEGVFIWDVDTDEERARLALLEARYGPLPPTLRTDTSNGQHVFLRWPDGHPRPLHKMFGLVTRWGSGRAAGYVIGPRSIHASGKEYTPAGVFEIATLPEAWAIAALGPESITISGPTPAEQVPVGGRHDWLRDRARFYAGTIRDPAVLLAAMLAENERLPQPKTREDVERAIGEVLERFPADPVEADPGTGELRRVASGDEPPMLSLQDDAGKFPPSPSPVAFGGFLGECTEHLMEGTDAPAVGLLASLMAFCGALMPAWSYWHGRHTSSPFLALVGKSAIGRKGTAMYRARDALGYALQMDVVNRVRFDGIASGEALVRALLDRAQSTFGVPTGVLFEEEYATFLAASGREGSNLDSRMRSAFDGRQLAHRRVGDTLFVPEPYYLSGLVGITPDELQAKVTHESFKNGSGNRWLWLPVLRRSVMVDSIEPIFPSDIQQRLLREHQATFRDPRRLEPGEGVSGLLSEYEEFLRTESIGLAADMTRRFAVIAFRCAMVHASVEGSSVVTVDHVLRSIALCEYSRGGLDFTFGDALGDAAATHLYRMLLEEGTLSQGSISKHFIRDPIKRQVAIDDLVRLGLAEVVKVPTAGRRRTELRIVRGRGGFRDFRALLTYPPYPEPTVARISDFHAQTASGEGAQKGAEAEKVLELSEAVVDTSTGEMTKTAIWAKPCDDYRAHQDDHRSRPGGWVCIACWPEEAI